ncbi:MAG: DUF2497 domain-containing protein [Alphaproteobacteria bacterium]
MNEHRIKPEPSMEEILASIREIIAAGEKAANQPAHHTATQPAPNALPQPGRIAAANQTPEPEVFELTEMVNEDGSVVTLQPLPVHNSARPYTPQPSYDQVGVDDIAETPYLGSPIDPPPSQLMDAGNTNTVLHRRPPPSADPQQPRARPTGRPPTPSYAPQPDGFRPSTSPGDSVMDRRNARDHTDPRRARPPAPDADNPFADLARSADEPAGVYDEQFESAPPRKEKSYRPHSGEPEDPRGISALSDSFDDREFGDFRIEDLVREQVEPVVREWLDNHLQPMVERIVRDEIRHLFSRRRS